MWALVCEGEEEQDFVDPPNELPDGRNWGISRKSENQRPIVQVVSIYRPNTIAELSRLISFIEKETLELIEMDLMCRG